MYMNALTKELLREALLLEPVEKAELIDHLFQSFDTSPAHAVDTHWSEEVESRLDAFFAGKMTADSIESVMERINQR
jgi:putative addiction module component (TIGR02574 family)